MSKAIEKYAGRIENERPDKNISDLQKDFLVYF